MPQHSPHPHHNQHQPHQTGTNLASHLERIVHEQESGLLLQMSSAQVPNTQQVIRPNPTASRPPPISSNPITSTVTTSEEQSKHSTRKRPGNQSNSNNKPITDRFDLQETTNKSAVELRVLAQNYATEGMNEVAVNAVLQFHEEMQTMIAIKALELGITVSVIEEIFGKYIGVRRPSAWNQFLRSDLAHAVFKEASGIHSGEAMKVLGAKWSSMDADEKKPYIDAAKKGKTHLDKLDNELEAIEVGPHTWNKILQPRTKVLTNAVCLKKYKDNAKRLLDNTIAKCVPIAKSNHFELVIIAVSNHIGKHNFQLTRNTAALDKQIKFLYDSDEPFPAQLQTYLLGKTIPELASDIANSSRRFKSQVVHNLSTVLRARTAETTLKTPSSALNHAKALALDQDLKEHLLRLVKRTEQSVRFDNQTITAPTPTSTPTQSVFDPSLI
ncbi:hypothetical protein DFH28DRAFT_1107863 [Melampsora americana]|nr:hypothetical protein DFH28DRAFT_1107863 [Melampsora americana]